MITTLHRIRGTFMGLTVHQDFDTPEEASTRIDQLRLLDPDLDLSVSPVLCLSPSLSKITTPFFGGGSPAGA